MRFAVLFGVVAVLAAASAAGAAPRPSYTVAFNGAGSEHRVDQQQNIQDDGTCDSAEHVGVTAALAWSAAWRGFRSSGRDTLSAAAAATGSRITGSHVKDACGLPLDQAPPDWVMQESCDVALATAGVAEMSVVERTAKALVIAVAAPPLAVPPGSGCSLNVRNDQLAAHVTVPLSKLATLKKGRSLTFAVGTAHPGTGDAYAPTLDCSQPTKPYEGYRTADHCQDDLSWSGSVRITRAS